MKNTIQNQWTSPLSRLCGASRRAVLSTALSAVSSGVLCALLLGAMPTAFAAGAGDAGDLPQAIASALRETGVAAKSAAVWVAPAGSRTPVLSINADRPMQPASTIKIVTTLAALDLLGPAHRFTTEFRAQALPDAQGRVRNLTVVGGGDPHYVIERLWLAAQRLSGMGVRTIEGDVAIDRSLFELADYKQGAFDGRGTRSYNVGADPAMVSFKSMTLTLTPVPEKGVALVTALPVLQGVAFPKTVKLVKGACGDWKGRLKADTTNPRNIRFKGSFPAACGEKALHLSLLPADDYFMRAFKHVLTQNGIVWKGRAVGADGRTKPAKGASTLLFADDSGPLAQSVYWTNKFSNNPMARQIFLALSFAADAGDSAQKKGAAPATLEKSRGVLARWLTDRAGVSGKPAPYVDNGSGLSRSTRISARALGEVLDYGFRSAVMPEFMTSLPVTGVDGTMKRRPLEAGSGHVKTGFLTNVRAAAGYVTDDRGMRWTVVAMVNADPMPEKAQDFTQAVLNWCAAGGARRAFQEQRAKK